MDEVALDLGPLRFDEAEHWGRIERALAALHALEVYPELIPGSGQLGAAVRGELKPTRSAIRRHDEEPREILGPLQTVQITDLRETWRRTSKRLRRATPRPSSRADGSLRR